MATFLQSASPDGTSYGASGKGWSSQSYASNIDDTSYIGPAPWTVPGNQSAIATGVIAETNHRYNIAGSNSPSTGVLYIMSITLIEGQSIGHIGFCTGSTATTAASHSWQVLLDNNYIQRGHTADGTTTNIAASTWYLNPLVTPYTAAYSGAFYLGLMFAVSSGSVCTVLGPNFNPIIQLITGTNVPTPLIGGQSTTGLTTPGTDGTTTYLAPTTVAPIYYMYVTA